jgi:hypothetical protein
MIYAWSISLLLPTVAVICFSIAKGGSTPLAMLNISVRLTILGELTQWD